MKRILLILLYIFSLKDVRCLLKGNCHLEGVNPTQWLMAYINAPINDTQRNEVKRFQTENVTSVQVSGTDFGTYFKAVLFDGFISVGLTPAFENYEKVENSVSCPELNVDLEFICEDARPAVLAFYQPINDLNTYTPEFSQQSYTYKIPMPIPAGFNLEIFGEDIIACDWDISNTRLKFAVDPSEDLTLAWASNTSETNKCHRAVLKTTKWLRLDSNKTYKIAVTDMGNPSKSSYSKLQILVDEEKGFPPNPNFESAYYTATYDCKSPFHTIEVENPIRLKGAYSNLTLNLQGDYEENFRAEVRFQEVLIALTENLPKHVWQKEPIAAIIIEVYLENAEEPGRTVLVTYLPKYHCKEIPSATIEFEEESYWFEVPYWYSGVLGFVKLKNDSNQVIRYSLESANGSAVPYQIEYDEIIGRLQLRSGINSSGVLYLIASAEGVHDKALVNVVIDSKQHSQLVETEYSLIIRHVPENSETRTLLSCPDMFSRCTYNVVKQYPTTDPVLFNVIGDADTFYAIASGYLNRQMGIFDNMDQPYFTLQVHSTDSFSPNTTSTSPSLREKTALSAVPSEWVCIPTKITKYVDQFSTLVLLDDINDNPPVFDEGKKLVIGYPSKELPIALIPRYLVKVHATDLDDGINAEIRYTTNSTCVTIHPKTGKIYPKENIFVTEPKLKFVVTATDMDGNETEGLSTDLEIEVKPLYQYHLIVLILNDTTLSDLDDTIEHLSSKLDINVRYLRTTVFPRRSNASKIPYSLKVVAYALDTEEQLIRNYALEKLLEDSVDLEHLEITTWQPSYESQAFICKEKLRKTSSRMYFLIGIAALVSLLVFVTTFGCFYISKTCRNTEVMRKRKARGQAKAKGKARNSKKSFN